MPKNLTEALAQAAAKMRRTDPEKIVETVIEERKPEYSFKTETYHAAPRTEMY